MCRSFYRTIRISQKKVIKKDGSKEDFSRDKLKRGIIKATWKRPVSLSDIDDLVDEIEQKLRQKKTSQVKSWEVGNLVINRLRKLDTLSYLLFASVYRDFESVEDFASEIERLQNLEPDQLSAKQSTQEKETSP